MQIHALLIALSLSWYQESLWFCEQSWIMAGVDRIVAINPRYYLLYQVIVCRLGCVFEGRSPYSSLLNSYSDWSQTGVSTVTTTFCNFLRPPLLICAHLSRLRGKGSTSRLGGFSLLIVVYAYVCWWCCHYGHVIRKATIIIWICTSILYDVSLDD